MKTFFSARSISTLTAILVFILAAISFRLSYDALQNVAYDHGIPGQLSYAWPLLVDFALVVFSLSVVRASLYNERTVWPWCLVGLFTLATIGFNLVHARPQPVAIAVAIMPPLALFLSFETLMGMLKSGVRRGEIGQSLQKLSDELQYRRQVLETLEQQIGQAEHKLATLQETVARHQVDNPETPMEKRRARLLDTIRQQGDIGVSSLSEALGVARSTVYKDIDALVESGQLARNGSGLEVVL